ncbi:hypothetical protein K1719_008699 [Acacia pycnantha]|nr:hypothetical protein K1719_008699 [Acacia pycnantha]
MLDLRLSEVESVAVNSVFELHKLLGRPGAIEKVLSVVKQMKPEIVAVVEQEANCLVTTFDWEPGIIMPLNLVTISSQRTFNSERCV